MEKKIGAKIIYTLDTVARLLLSEYQVSLPPQAYVEAKITHKKCAISRPPVVQTALNSTELEQRMESQGVEL